MIESYIYHYYDPSFGLVLNDNHHEVSLPANDSHMMSQCRIYFRIRSHHATSATLNVNHLRLSPVLAKGPSCSSYEYCSPRFVNPSDPSN